jgi:hypothetical protein
MHQFETYEREQIKRIYRFKAKDQVLFLFKKLLLLLMPKFYLSFEFNHLKWFYL